MVLFFLPHAGGSAKSYCTFKRYLPRDLKVVPMELSGRFTRSGEPLLTEVSACVADLIQTHRLLLEQEPYALFGHRLEPPDCPPPGMPSCPADAPPVTAQGC